MLLMLVPISKESFCTPLHKIIDIRGIKTIRTQLQCELNLNIRTHIIDLRTIKKYQNLVFFENDRIYIEYVCQFHKYKYV